MEMKKHLLVTVSDQKSALYGIKFISRLFENKENIQLTLYFTFQKSPTVWESNHRDRTYINITKKNEAKGKEALQNAKKELCDLGFKEDQIVTKLDVRTASTAKDILHEGAAGRYDAVVLGKRGVGWLEETFEESVTKNLLKETFVFPIWLCRLSDAQRSGVLVCVDGSEAAFRMVDHVGYILKDETSQNVTLLTVNQNNHDTGGILSKAKELMLKNGFPEGMIKTITAKNKNVGKAILKEAKNGKYTAIAMGRREREPKLIKNIFLGSVSAHIFENLEKASLWICH